MKILGKNVVVGTKKICVEYTSKIHGGFGDCFFESDEFKGENLEKNVIFIREKNGYLIEIGELDSFPTLSLICFGAARRWKTSPRNAGDFYVDEIKPYFDSKVNQEKLFDVKTIVKILTIEKKIEIEKQQNSVNQKST